MTWRTSDSMVDYLPVLLQVYYMPSIIMYSMVSMGLGSLCMISIFGAPFFRVVTYYIQLVYSRKLIEMD